MPIIEGLLLSSESWFEVDSTKEYQYPGVFSEQEDTCEPNASQTTTNGSCIKHLTTAAFHRRQSPSIIQ